MDDRIGVAEFDTVGSQVQVGWGEFDATAGQDCRVGWGEFDATAGQDCRVGWCEFDATATIDCRVGWAEFDCLTPAPAEIPPFYPGGGQSGYHDLFEKKLDLQLDIDEEDEEAVLVTLMEFAQNVL